jgi:hypothetical protein
MGGFGEEMTLQVAVFSKAMAGAFRNAGQNAHIGNPRADVMDI